MDYGYLLLFAFGLVFVIEGLLPFSAPKRYREWLVKLAKLSDAQLRKMGMVLLAIGVILVLMAHWLM